MTFAKESIVGVFVVLGLVCVSYLTIKLGCMEVFDSSGYTVTARFSSVTGLRTGANVEIAGVPVGRVTSIRLDPQTFMADVDLRINDGVNLSDDVMASVKTSGLIGDKYISLAPGGSDTPLKNGDTITDTEPTLDLEALIGKVVFGGV
ncbi:MAG: outer membrane lipid asymmetry maintenance protein MlaD [Desulfovibrionaceae bacterium]|nr:MAG: outer membrane lipid asymmetry maintenance protein MlaD [Desulfovibrionaceae bacterium]